MDWTLSWRTDPIARGIADRHYSRKTVGAKGFVQSGSALVLLTRNNDALWVTVNPIAEYVRHAWAGAWQCSLFRNEGPTLSSDLIRQAMAHTRWYYHDNPLGMVTFVDAGKVRHKRDPGRCFIKAGFRYAGLTKGGLLAFVIAQDDMPLPQVPDLSRAPLNVKKSALNRMLCALSV